MPNLPRSFPFADSVMGTDNGPACGNCAGTIYMYAAVSDAAPCPMFAARCVTCGEETAYVLSAAATRAAHVEMVENSPGTYVTREGYKPQACTLCGRKGVKLQNIGGRIVCEPREADTCNAVEFANNNGYKSGGVS